MRTTSGVRHTFMVNCWLGFTIAQSTVARYMYSRSLASVLGLANLSDQSCRWRRDLFVLPTITFRLYLVVLRHERQLWVSFKSDRGSLHLNSTKPKALRQTSYTDFRGISSHGLFDFTQPIKSDVYYFGRQSFHAADQKRYMPIFI